MKFCDKLVKLRKNNNMSQEQLACLLGVSRQAVSKWESGISMPDMEKIMQLCKVLDCSLDDIVDDDACGNKDNKNIVQKVNFRTYLDEVLNFITRTLNMFWSMRFVDKVKCILEMLFFVLVMLIIWMVVGNIISSIFSGILYMLPNSIYRIVGQICRIIYSIFGIFVGFILFIHIFKIRYLDYFVTIEDETSTSKSIEEPVDVVKEDSEKRQFIEKKKNKIIIRDPKHSTYNFFNILALMIVWFIKFVLLFVAFFAIISFIFLIFGLTISLWYVKNGIFFLGISIILIGCILINYIILEVIYKFILNRAQMYKRIFLCFIIGLILFGMGAGISTLAYTTFSIDDNSYIDYDTRSFDIDNKVDDVVIDFIKYPNVSLVRDDNYSSVSIEFTYNDKGAINFYNYTDYVDSYTDNDSDLIKYNVYSYNYSDNYDGIDTFNSIMSLLSKKKRIDNYYADTVTKIVIKGSNSDIDKLLDNYNKYNRY